MAKEVLGASDAGCVATYGAAEAAARQQQQGHGGGQLPNERNEGGAAKGYIQLPKSPKRLEV